MHSPEVQKDIAIVAAGFESIKSALALGESPTLNDLGVLMRKKGNTAGSVAMLEESLAMRRSLLGPKHKDIAVTLSELGRSVDDQGQPERAESLAREALAIWSERLARRHDEEPARFDAHGARALR